MATTFGIYIGQQQQAVGSKAKMLAEAKKITSGHVAVWELTTDGRRIGRKPIYRTFNGKKK